MKDRLLVDEVAKVEYGMARHVIRVQVIVLRYIKALLVVLATTMATFVMAAAVESSQTIDTGTERWLVATLVVWAPAVLFVSSSPVRWLGTLLMSEGATTSGIRYDRDLTRLERIASIFSIVVLGAAIACGVVLATRDATTIGAVAFLLVGAVGVAAEVWLLRHLRS
ncbi:MAG: hypothetical protein ACKOA2_03525 [Ilumatobacteraceae bacterium]